MHEQDLRIIPALRELQILDADHPTTRSIASDYAASDIAVADDTVRLWDLLHRREYRALCGVRREHGGESVVRVYFRRIDLD